MVVSGYVQVINLYIKKGSILKKVKSNLCAGKYRIHAGTKATKPCLIPGKNCATVSSQLGSAFLWKLD